MISLIPNTLAAFSLSVFLNCAIFSGPIDDGSGARRPSVMTTDSIVSPAAAIFATVPPIPISTSSGCALIRRTRFMKLWFWDLCLNQQRQQSERLLPAEIAGLNRYHVRNIFLHDIHLGSNRD